jgi:aryl-alcohol dehydrogenase-like predicted oxidoreductase
MRTIRLGNSDMQITPLGIGAWAMGGGGWAYGWGPQDDQDSIAAIHAALDAGINWIDTAAVYGLGHSEEVIARALQGRSNRPHIFTKCGLTWAAAGEIRRTLKADSIRREAEASLRRLRVDVIDLYQIHWPDPDRDMEEAWEILATLKAEGKVRHIGVSNFNAAQMERAQKIAPITSLQPPYSLLARDIETSILPFAAAHGIGVIVYSPMKSGLLSGAMTRERIAAFPADDFRRTVPHFREPMLSRNLRLVELLRSIGKRHGRSPGEVAIAWTLGNPLVTGAIVGLRSRQQLDGVIGAAEFRLSQSELNEIDTFLKSTDTWGLRARIFARRCAQMIFR